MRKLIVSEFVSLDGVMQAPGGKDEDRDGGFEQIRTACASVASIVLMLLLMSV
jgi:hypothetical protein